MRILSGIKPSGKLHIGNYFGMMRPALKLAQTGEAFYFIADYHALTTVSKAAELRENSLDIALDFLACGLDPSKTVFYRQSDVPQVTARVKALGSQGTGLIGMKLVGEGQFTQPEDRDAAIRYAFNVGKVDAVTIGYENTAEIDEAIARINRELNT